MELPVSNLVITSKQKKPAPGEEEEGEASCSRSPASPSPGAHAPVSASSFSSSSSFSSFLPPGARHAASLMNPSAGEKKKTEGSAEMKKKKKEEERGAREEEKPSQLMTSTMTGPSPSIERTHVMLQRIVGNLAFRVMKLLWRSSQNAQEGGRALLPTRPLWLVRRLQREKSSAGKGWGSRERVGEGEEERDQEARGEHDEQDEEELLEELKGKGRMAPKESCCGTSRRKEREREEGEEEGDVSGGGGYEEEQRESKGGRGEGGREGKTRAVGQGSDGDMPKALEVECWRLLSKTREFNRRADRLMSSLQIHLYTRGLIQLASYANSFLDRTVRLLLERVRSPEISLSLSSPFLFLHLFLHLFLSLCLSLYLRMMHARQW